ncbi:MAG: ATP-binding cassette domain-containing protein [Candidatus Heimdallarchaeum aukensis]|uniref:ATP-binding cassette domain-containing protein n=1 Tax=Candidatus Heimdallarchaeum aukensis TaxID=2876573 RepID=A0A9Y1BLA7_9ARCH|nr:MAG: ATP-binding cassette domain-containing protein [Candidatus Heimdallarchaeum aukensis]
MIQADDLLKVYYDPITEYKVAALRGLSLDIKEGQLVSIIGPSGSGKTTLINILAGLDVPTGGRVIVKGQQLDKMTERERREFRYYNIGLINQFISQNLFPRLTVIENLMIPKRMFCLPHETAKKEVEELLELLRLKHIAKNNVEKISGGEAIRLSLGVALAKNPDILLCDEPTGQLDNMHTKEVVETIKDVNITMGKTILVVTHDIRFRTVFERSFIIRDGRLAGISVDINRNQLEFLMESSEMKRSYVDPSNFARIPDEIKRSLGIKDTVEYDLHPSKKIGLIWNPDLITREDIFHILNNPEEEYEETVDQISYEDVEPILSRSFVPPEKEEPIIKISNLKKGYPSPAGYNLVLKGINLSINKGDFVFISGPSGVGKTTLFNCISGLDKIDDGHVEIMGFDIKNQPEPLISDFRLKHISYITQHNNLFEPLLVEDNLFLPYLFLGEKIDIDYAKKIMKECFIDHKIKSYPDELSAGEKQRAALATSLARKTSILIADEPTANLNSELARSIINLFMDISKLEQKTVIICSHDLSLLRPGFRHIRLSDGQIAEDYRVTKEQLQEIITEYLSIQKNKKNESIT